MHREHIGALCEPHHRREILDRVVGHLLVEVRADDVRGRDHHERVAVGRCLRDFGGADGRSGAGLVLDDDGLADRGRELLLQDARRDVGESAGAEGDDDLDGLRGELLRLRVKRKHGDHRDHRDHGKEKGKKAGHEFQAR
jgi:hypothetical protein